MGVNIEWVAYTWVIYIYIRFVYNYKKCPQ